MKTIKTICDECECDELEIIPESAEPYCHFFERFVDKTTEQYCRKLYENEKLLHKP